MALLERSKITVREQLLFKKKLCYGSFRYVSNLSKKVFSGAPVKCVFLCDSDNSDSVVSVNAAFGEIKDHSLRMTLFEKNIINGNFGFVSTLNKKVSGAPMKCFSLYGSNNSDSVVFENAAFGEIKDHSLIMTPFQKNPFLWKF